MGRMEDEKRLETVEVKTGDGFKKQNSTEQI